MAAAESAEYVYSLTVVLPVLLLSLGAAAFDVQSGRIPNRLLLLFLPVAAGIRVWTGGVPAAADGAAAGAAVLVLLWPLFRFRMIGAGDIKLLAASAVLAGFSGIFRILAGTLAGGGILSILLIAADGISAERFRYALEYARAVLVTGERVSYRTSSAGGAAGPGGIGNGQFHFSVAVFTGVLLWSGGIV